jgi:putative peptidoglycan lipid II flippase
VIVAVGQGEGQTLLMLRLLRVMFPYLLLVCLAAIFMGMLNARGHFFIPAIGAATLNVVMIASVLWLAPRMGGGLETQIFGLAVGVVVAGIVQAVFQMPLLSREGFAPQWISPWRDETVLRVVRQMLPAAVGVAAYQINVMLTQGIAFWVDAGIVASFNYAVRLMELPQGVFGLSLATYLLPTLSGLAAEKKYPEFRSTLGQGLGYLVFERGQFDSFSTSRAALALACLAPGLVAFSVVNILARAFYALGDTTTPMKISLFTLALNAAFTVVLIGPLRQGGLGVANTMSALVNVALLFYALRRKLGKLELPELRRGLLLLLGNALVAGAVAWFGWRAWDKWLGHATLPLKLGEVFVPMTLATLAYFGLSAWLKLGYTRALTAMLAAKLGRGRS